MRRYLLAVALAAVFTGPALAAQFYVVMKSTTKTCQIIGIPPDGKKMVLVGRTSYPTKEDARAAEKTAPECQGAAK
jgi:hypothetical protein